MQFAPASRSGVSRLRLAPSPTSSPTSSLYSQVESIIRDSPRLDAHRDLLAGPFRAIVTTNWDSFFEWAWKGERGIRGGRHNPDSQSRHRLAHNVPVRYRSDVALFFAELKAGMQPAPLFKLHGDWSESGRPEFIAGHSDFRKLMVRDVSSLQLLRNLSANSSFLFYG